MDENDLARQVFHHAHQQDLTLQIWDAFCRGDSDLARQLLEEEVLNIVMTVEIGWTKLPLDSAARQMVSWLLEGLINRLEANGNVICEIEIGGKTQVYDCAATCRTLLPRFRDEVTPEL